MFTELLNSGTLNVIYTLIVVVSFLFAVLSLVGAEVGEVFDFDLDSDFNFISVSPFALASFGTTFGTVGLITRLLLEMEAVPSLLWATGLGLLIGAAGQAFFIYILSPSKSSHFSLDQDALNREAEVTLSIPPDGLGQVAFNNISGRVTLGARSTTGDAIRTGQIVVIERISGRVAFVRPLVPPS